MRQSVLWTILAILMCVSPALADEPAMTARNHFFLELLGNGGAYSINYERFLADRWTVRLGFSEWSSQGFWSNNENTYLLVPVTSSLLFGKGSNFLEVGGGVVWGRITKKYDNGIAPTEKRIVTNLTGFLGYRHQHPYGGFVFRAGFTPFYSLNNENKAWPDEDFTPSIGFSWGGAF
jgi:hypothetical protein